MVNHKKDKETLKELRELTKVKENWKERLDDVASKLNENYSTTPKDWPVRKSLLGTTLKSSKKMAFTILLKVKTLKKTSPISSLNCPKAICLIFYFL